jgi:hypothetical protein
MRVKVTFLWCGKEMSRKTHRKIAKEYEVVARI